MDDGELGDGKGPIFEENEYEEIHRSPIETAFYALEKEMKEPRSKSKSSIPKTTKKAQNAAAQNSIANQQNT